MRLETSHIITALIVLGIGVYMTTQQSARGIRNNNPLNIEAGENWVGLVGTDGRFAIFETAEHGIRAAARILRTYATKYGIVNIDGIINRWAPPTENDTANYIEFVSKRVGVDSQQPLSESDYPKVIAAMITMENGEQPYQPEQIQRGFEWGFYG
ncbi:virion protein [Pseudoalteromonas piscicida]|uniref:Virion protein n=1 Tax=Pseudoalteromonas piscicida TaxID=43662 RepID=A0AAD0RIU2_PSEO7|nr:virion protein [Pseudoalteromonas piscicida]AXR03555.1 virion protein [Pseudoalteromonas piscicida]